MTPQKLAAFADALARIPQGRSTGLYAGRRYQVVKSRFNAGRSVKLVGEELGGQDYVSLNFYDLDNGPALRPCEMPAGKVADFVLGYQVET